MVLSPRFYALVVLATVSAVASAQRVELLDFYLPTCSPCRAMAPTIDRLAAEGVAVRKIDGSRQRDLAARLRVESYPTFIIAVDGRETGRVVGATSYASLRELLDRERPNTIVPVSASSRTFAPSTAEQERAFTVGPDAGPGSPPPAITSQTIAPNASHTELIGSAVRLTVEDPNGRSYGTGTLIDARSGEALVVTCAHLFRDASGGPMDVAGKLAVELFAAGPGTPQPIERVAGNLVSYDFEADVALVSLRTEANIRVAPVADSQVTLTPGSPVRSVGCDGGAAPSVRDSRVVSLNRYDGPPNIETTGAPVQGRSGGGLFDESGALVGVCFAADHQSDEGLYAGLASIHDQLDRIGLQEIYRSAPEQAAPAPPVIAAAAPAPEPLAAAPVEASRPSQMEPVAPSPGSLIRAQGAARTESLDPVERATLEEITNRGRASEVVILIRPHEPGGKTEVLTLDAASPAMLQALRASSTRSAW